MKKAVLFLTFNRPDETKRVFEQIKIAAPKRLYIASDGARAHKEGEKEVVEQLRAWILKNIDWECEVKTKFNIENLGCGKGVSSAITWFFEQEEDGIILEDDCLPEQSFFTYCEELLVRYKEDKRIWHITGDNPLRVVEREASYYFAKIPHVWGWASWADRWKGYTFDLKNYNKKYIKHISNNKKVQSHWFTILKKMQNQEIDTWDYQWGFNIFQNKGFCINPCKNLISNIGFSGVHYVNNADQRLGMKTYALDRIMHPKKVVVDLKAVELINDKLVSRLERDVIRCMKKLWVLLK